MHITDFYIMKDKHLISCISDSHNLHQQLNKWLQLDIFKDVDTIIHAGDISGLGREWEVRDFLKWFSKLNFQNKIFIAGNHDWLFEKEPFISKEILKEYPNIIYLQDQSIIIDGLKIYGSPWQPAFCNWAFNLSSREKLEACWNQIPSDTDILITHGPPLGILDLNKKMKQCGDIDLLNRIWQIKPIVHCFGHIHREFLDSKTFSNYETCFINSSSCNEAYNIVNKPILIEVDLETKRPKIIDY